MTPYETVYNAFLSKILEDEWQEWLIEEAEQDWRQILEAAIPWFKFPRVPLDRDENGFINTLTNEEIQIIANYMKCEWLNRCILTWENVKPLYTERDFSQANLLDKLSKMLESERQQAKDLESIYYRSRSGRPFKFSNMGTRCE